MYLGLSLVALGLLALQWLVLVEPNQQAVVPALSQPVENSNQSHETIRLADAPAGDVADENRNGVRAAPASRELAVSLLESPWAVPPQGMMRLGDTLTRDDLERLRKSGAVQLSLGDIDVDIALSLDAEGRLLIAPLEPLAFNGVYRVALSEEARGILGLAGIDDIVFLTEQQGSTDGQLIDFDHDGDADLVIANYGLPLSMARNDGDDFLSGGLPGTAFDSTGLSLADFDQDGLIDLAVSQFSAGSGSILRLLRNRSGAEGFEVADETDLLLPASMNQGRGLAVETADLDLDGDADLLVVDFERGLRVYLNQAGLQGGQLGRFEEAEHLTPAEGLERATCVTLADVDRDGDMDVFVGRAYQPDVLLQNTFITQGARGQRFEFVHAGTVPGGSLNTSAARFADLDGDGDADLVVAVLGGFNRIYMNQWASGEAFAAFRDETGMRAPDFLDARDWSTALEIGAVTGGGFPDIVVANIDPNASRNDERARNRLYINNGNGFFRAAALNGPAGARTLSVAGGDFIPADGVLDLYFFADGPNLLLSGAADVFSRPATFYSKMSFEAEAVAVDNGVQPLDAVELDVNGDARTDVALAGADGAVYFALADDEAPGGFSLFRMALQSSGAVRGLTPADFDLDGDTDLFVRAERGDFILVSMLSQGIDGYAIPYTAVAAYTPRAPDAGCALLDYDFDGDLDVVTANEKELTFFENTRAPLRGFPSLPTAHDLGAVRGLAAADLTGNGRAELALAGERGIAVYANAGPAAGYRFERLAFLADARGAEALQILDADRDGRVEIIALVDGLVRVYAWTGLEFARTDSLSFPRVPLRSARFFDLDRDGDLDLFGAGADGSARLFVNDGRFHFSAEYQSGAPLRAAQSLREAAARFGDVVRLLPIDANCDGAPDLLLLSTDGRLQIVTNKP